MIDINIVQVKKEGEKLGLDSNKILSGVRLFKGKSCLVINDIIEAQMQILSLSLKDVENLTQLFTFAKYKDVEFYYVEISNCKKLRVRTITKTVETHKEKPNMDKHIWDELTGNKKNIFDYVNDLMNENLGHKNK